MKTVSGKVISSKGVSLSKAARILSKFALSDNGASPAFSAYLKRASVSFDELVQLHKEFKGLGSFERKNGRRERSVGVAVTEETVNSVKKPSEGDGLVTEEKQEGSEWTGDGEGSTVVRKEVGNSEGLADEREAKENDEKCDEGRDGDVGAMIGNVNGDAKKVKEKKMKDQDGNDVEHETKSRDEVKEKRKEKKRRDKGDKEGGDGALKIETDAQGCLPSKNDASGKVTEVVENGGNEQKKQKKRKVKEEKESSEASKESKKRKHKGDADGVLEDSVERHKSKKKKVKIEAHE